MDRDLIELAIAILLSLVGAIVIFAMRDRDTPLGCLIALIIAFAIFVEFLLVLAALIGSLEVDTLSTIELIWIFVFAQSLCRSRTLDSSRCCRSS